MKKIILGALFFFSFLLFNLFSFSNSIENSREYQMSDAEKCVNRFMGKATKSLNKKYNMRICGTKVGMPGGPVRLLGLSFQILHSLTREEARYLLINCSEDFLKMINTDEELRSYLKCSPFNLLNIEIDIFSIDKSGRDVYDPYIRVASLINNELSYCTKDKDQKFGYKSEYEESYDEAVQLLLKKKKRRGIIGSMIVKMILFPVIFSLFFSFTSFCNANQTPREYQISDAEKSVNIVLSNATKFLIEKYQLKVIGEGVAMPGGHVKKLSLDFQIQGPVAKEELRKIVIEITHDFLKLINSDQNFRRFSNCYPFTLKNVQIGIFVIDNEGREVLEPDISIVEIYQGFLIFRTVDKSNTFKYKSEYRESYDEAIQPLLQKPKQAELQDQ